MRGILASGLVVGLLGAALALQTPATATTDAIPQRDSESCAPSFRVVPTGVYEGAIGLTRDGKVLARVLGEGALALFSNTGSMISSYPELGLLDNASWVLQGNGVVLGTGGDGIEPYYPWVYQHGSTHPLELRRDEVSATAARMNRVGVVVGYENPFSRVTARPLTWSSPTSPARRLPTPRGFSGATPTGISSDGNLIRGIGYKMNPNDANVPLRLPVIWKERQPIELWHPTKFSFLRWSRGVMVGTVTQPDGSQLGATFAHGVLTTYPIPDATVTEVMGVLPNGTVGGFAVDLANPWPRDGFITRGGSTHVFEGLELRAIQPSDHISALFIDEREKVVVGTCLAPLLD